MMVRHPSRAVLQEWLAGADEPQLDKHLGTCDRCASTLEELEPTPPTGPVGDARSDALSEALAEALAPPEDLTQRLEQGLAAKLSSRQMLEVVADLFGAGFEATRLLTIGEPVDDS